MQLHVGQALVSDKRGRFVTYVITLSILRPEESAGFWSASEWHYIGLIYTPPESPCIPLLCYTCKTQYLTPCVSLNTTDFFIDICSLVRKFNKEMVNTSRVCYDVTTRQAPTADHFIPAMITTWVRRLLYRSIQYLMLLLVCNCMWRYIAKEVYLFVCISM